MRWLRQLRPLNAFSPFLLPFFSPSPLPSFLSSLPLSTSLLLSLRLLSSFFTSLLPSFLPLLHSLSPSLFSAPLSLLPLIPPISPLIPSPSFPPSFTKTNWLNKNHSRSYFLSIGSSLALILVIVVNSSSSFHNLFTNEPRAYNSALIWNIIRKRSIKNPRVRVHLCKAWLKVRVTRWWYVLVFFYIFF